MYAQYMYSNLLWQKQPSPPPTHTHRMCALTNLLSSLVLDQQIYRLHQQHPWNTGGQLLSPRISGKSSAK